MLTKQMYRREELLFSANNEQRTKGRSRDNRRYLGCCIENICKVLGTRNSQEKAPDKIVKETQLNNKTALCAKLLEEIPMFLIQGYKDNF